MEKHQRPLILISNDDALLAPGLRHLVECSLRFGDVVVAAPAQPQSGKSSALTVSEALRVQQHPGFIPGAEVYTVNGTPVDCVKVAMHTLVPRKPDFLFSGINHGSNAAINNLYSGTMGAAMEGCVLGMSAVGFSILDHSMHADFSPILPYVEKIIGKVVSHGLPQGVCLNVNFPAHCKVEGLKVLKGARGHWTDEYADYADPAGRPFYMLSGSFHNDEPDNPETDEYWLARGYGSIVPIRPDQTATDSLQTISDILFD